MADLTERVDACVGPARAVHTNSLLRDFACGSVDLGWNRRGAGLELPTVEVRAVVGDCELDVAHLFGTTR